MNIFETIRNAIRNFKEMISAAWKRKFLNNFKSGYNSVTVSEIKDFSWVKWFKGEYNVRMQKEANMFRGILVGIGSYLVGIRIAMFIFGPFFGVLTVIPAIFLGMTFSLFGTAIDLKFQAQ